MLHYVRQMLGRQTAASGPTASPHRYWRLYIGSDSFAGTAAVSVAECEMREAVGGADVTGSGTATADSTFSGFSASAAFANDGDTTSWASGTGAYPHWLQYDFGVGVTKAIVEIAIISRTSNLDQGPGRFKVQSSDNGTTWTDEWWIVYPGGNNGHGYAASTFKVFTKPSSTQIVGTPHRYWRLSITGSNGGSFVGAQNIELVVVAGSTDETEGGTATSRSNFSGLPPSNAFVGMFTVADAGDWASNNVGFPEWIQYDFGSGNDKSITEARYVPRAGAAGSQSPTGIDFQYSDDGVNFTTIRSVSSLTGWASQTEKTWTLP